MHIFGVDKCIFMILILKQKIYTCMKSELTQVTYSKIYIFVEIGLPVKIRHVVLRVIENFIVTIVT